MPYAQHLATGRFDSQHRLQQEAVVAAIADGTQSRGRGMVLIVHFGRVLDQQHLLVVSHGLSRLLDMRADQLLIADLRRLQEAIGRKPRRLASHLLGQGGRRVSSDGCSHRHRSLGTTLMTQADLPKGLLGPLGGTQQSARLHQLPPFSCLDSFLMDSITNSHPKLWLTVRRVPGGAPLRLSCNHEALLLLPHTPVSPSCSQQAVLRRIANISS